MRSLFRCSLLWLVGSMAIGCVTVRGPVQPLASKIPGSIIEAVDISGNRRISREIIRSNIETKAGSILDPSLVERDIQRLQGLGYFDNVRVEEKDGEVGKIVTFHVREKPQ